MLPLLFTMMVCPLFFFLSIVDDCSPASIDAIITATDLANYATNVEVCTEGIKCMVNFAIRALEMQRNDRDSPSLVLGGFRRANWAVLTADALKVEVEKSKDSEAVFVLCRLLNMELWDSELISSVSNQSLVDLLTQLLDHSISAIEQNANEGAVDTRRFSIAGDVMRIFFQITQEYGPLNKNHASAASAYPITSEASKLEDKTKQEAPMPLHISNLFLHTIELLKRALLFDFTDPRKSQLQLACVTYALNLPKEQILKFDAYTVLPHLMNICIHHLETHQGNASASFLMLFTKIARDEPRTRAIFMMRFFPRWKEVFENDSGEGVRMPEEHNGTPGKLVIDAMQSADTGLHFYANEFVFLLCNESAGAFTKFVGFGPAAGHLAVRGLMNMGGAAAAGAGGTGQHPQGAAAGMDAAALAASGGQRVSNWREKRIDNPDMSDMSPEDIKEWNDLCDKMERLDNLGMIKMVHAPEGSDEEDQAKKQKGKKK